MRYLIQFAVYALGMLPVSLRGEKIQAWVKVLIRPLQTLNDGFAVYVNDTFYLVSFTGQVIYLEKVLNDLYDPIGTGIYITDGNNIGIPKYVYTKAENRPIYIYNKAESSTPVYVYNKTEYLTSLDFIVNVPAALLNPALETQIMGIVERYKLAGKRYTIVPV